MLESSKCIEVIKIKIALFSGNKSKFSGVFTPSVLKKLSEYGEISQRIDKSNIERHKEFLSDCKIAFATWGMPEFTEEEIKKYMPCLEVVFTVQEQFSILQSPFLIAE